MSKYSRKINEGLEARRKAFQPTMPSGQRCNPPGSQNRKKSGFGSRSKRR